jgi:hypothetical protein
MVRFSAAKKTCCNSHLAKLAAHAQHTSPDKAATVSTYAHAHTHKCCASCTCSHSPACTDCTCSHSPACTDCTCSHSPACTDCTCSHSPACTDCTAGLHPQLHTQQRMHLCVPTGCSYCSFSGQPNEQLLCTQPYTGRSTHSVAFSAHTSHDLLISRVYEEGALPL